MRITKKNYPERLRKTINKESPCGVCSTTISPNVPRLWRYIDSNQTGDQFMEQGREEENICVTICRDFVKLKKPARHRRTCPCYCVGKKRAIERAEKYLKLWDKGEHHWQAQKAH